MIGNMARLDRLVRTTVVCAFCFCFFARDFNVLNFDAHLLGFQFELAIEPFYIFKILNCRGSRRIEYAVQLEGCIGEDRSFRETLQEKILTDSINEFLAGLKENERKVFVCRYWYFDSIEDIAKRFSYSSSKTKMMLKRTRDRLKDHLIKEGVLQ